MSISSFHRSTELSFVTFDQLDPSWCYSEAKKIIRHHPISEKANASGKFYRSYECWHFHKSSSWPLIKVFQKTLEKQRHHFQSLMNKKLEFEFVVLSRVKDLNTPVSEYHKDGYFFDGQLHLTIKGGANINIRYGKYKTSLQFPNGQLWYLNGTKYMHQVPECENERIELCAPLNQIKEDIEVKMQAVSNDHYKWLDGNNPTWLNLRKRQAQHVKNAINKGTASNLKVACFSVE